MSTAIDHDPPPSPNSEPTATLLQIAGLLDLYESWLEGLDGGPNGIATVRAEIQQRADFFRQVIVEGE